MAKNKFSDKDIIKGLECCNSDNKYLCPNCPYDDDTAYCIDRLNKDALDLINRQQKTIERLNADAKRVDKDLEELDRPLTEIRAKAVKEFASEIINDLLPKTMVGYDEKALELSLSISNKIQEMEAGTNECS